MCWEKLRDSQNAVTSACKMSRLFLWVLQVYRCEPGEKATWNETVGLESGLLRPGRKASSGGYQAQQADSKTIVDTCSDACLLQHFDFKPQVRKRSL